MRGSIFMSVATFEILVKGRVQCVGYRWFVYENALELGLTGYVKNMSDGSVFVVAQGDQQNLVQFTAKLRTGPSFAHVLELDISESDEEIQYSLFKIVQ